MRIRGLVFATAVGLLLAGGAALPDASGSGAAPDPPATRVALTFDDLPGADTKAPLAAPDPPKWALDAYAGRKPADVSPKASATPSR